MKISTSFDLGDSVVPGQIKLYVKVESTLDESWSIPDIREILAQDIAPILRHMKMPEKNILRRMEQIRLSGILANAVKYPYRYDTLNHQVIDVDDPKHPIEVRDYLKALSED